MSRITQPICQVRLTNVAVVKLKTHGKRFEIACYRNKVVNFRSGIEGDIDEVLQTVSVFQNVSKGLLANKDDLVKAFGMADQEKVCRIILEKGELQISDRERRVETDALLRDVCTFVASRCVNPRTGLPLTVNTVERALRECQFSVRLGESAKRQALKAIDVLRAELPNQVARALMLMRVTCDVNCEGAMRTFLEETCQALIEKENHYSVGAGDDPSSDKVGNAVVGERSGDADVGQPNGSDEVNLLGVVGAEGRASEIDGVKAEGVASIAAARDGGGGGYVEFQLVCDPSKYREIDTFVNYTLQPRGTLQLMSSSAKGARTFPVEGAAGGGLQTASKPPVAKSTNGTPPGNANLDGDKRVDGGEGEDCSPCDATGSSGRDTHSPSPSSVTPLPSPVPGRTTTTAAATSGAMSCTTCKSRLANSNEYRSHCRSEWHGLNVKRKVKGLAPVSKKEYDELAEDLVRGFLAVES